MLISVAVIAEYLPFISFPDGAIRHGNYYYNSTIGLHLSIQISRVLIVLVITICCSQPKDNNCSSTKEDPFLKRDN
jgi:hypothetical protein